ncbi:MurR/RpiR family transcriptional regulator [Rhizobium sp. S153]|uniref:MurR/RpiR family transcriptional regulator n=1 Tax=Ciceribacter sichuanensis TaxID=2949647 RepID=A0ABT0VDK1_9HYPH|nr:MurR/RpiR family transcriptional regulator [Ciceribacter sp. S153]
MSDSDLDQDKDGQGSERKAPAGDLRQKLLQQVAAGTPAERAIAGYLLSNLQSIPFETAATVAVKIGVSEASIGRFCRSIGYRSLKDLKGGLQSDLGDQAWLIGDRLQDFHLRSQSGKDELARALEKEMAALVAVYEIAATAGFDDAVKRLARRPNVFVAGFQTERGHAAELVHNLQYLRAGVQLADVAGGHFGEILLSPPETTALVLIDGRRYSRLTRDLAFAAHDAGIPVTLITDPYCDWAHDAVSELFAVPTDLNHFWDTTSAMSSLIGLLVNGVFKELGTEVEERMARISTYYDNFIGHTGQFRRQPRSES